MKFSSFTLFILATIFSIKLFGQAGNPDSSFGTDGKVTTFLGDGNGGNVIYAMAIQPDGKIVAAGDAQVHVKKLRNNFRPLD